MLLDKGQKIGIAIISILFVIVLLVTKNMNEELNQQPKYTIGKIDKFVRSSNGSYLFYHYYVGGKKFENVNSYEHKFNAKAGDYHRVKYSTEKPELAKIIQSERITDSAQIVNAGLKLPKRKPRRNQFRD